MKQYELLHNHQIQIIHFFKSEMFVDNLTDLDGVGDEAEDGSGPEEYREARKEMLAELNPL